MINVRHFPFTELNHECKKWENTLVRKKIYHLQTKDTLPIAFKLKVCSFTIPSVRRDYETAQEMVNWLLTNETLNNVLFVGGTIGINNQLLWPQGNFTAQYCLLWNSILKTCFNNAGENKDHQFCSNAIAVFEEVTNIARLHAVLILLETTNHLILSLQNLVIEYAFYCLE